MNLDELAYPIGKFEAPVRVDTRARDAFVQQVAAVPDALRKAVEPLNDRQLDTPYGPGGWTVRQVVHHLPDSHLNAHVRFKLALTEAEPTIRHPDLGVMSLSQQLALYAWHGRDRIAQITSLAVREGWV